MDGQIRPSYYVFLLCTYVQETHKLRRQIMRWQWLRVERALVVAEIFLTRVYWRVL